MACATANCRRGVQFILNPSSASMARHAEEFPGAGPVKVIDCAAIPSPSRRCHACGHGRCEWRRRLRRRPSVNGCSSASPACWVSRRRCSCHRHDEQPVRAMAHCGRGRVHRGQMAHTIAGRRRAAVLGSIQPQPLAQLPDGSIPLAEIEAAIKPDDAHYARSGCWRWRTPGRAGAAAAYIEAAAALRGAVACDAPGRRTSFNAAWPRHSSKRRCARPCTPIAVTSTASRSASAGLGAGGLRAVRFEGVHRPRHASARCRRGMRQAGVLAAAALHALEHQSTPGRRQLTPARWPRLLACRREGVRRRAISLRRLARKGAGATSACVRRVLCNGGTACAWSRT